MRMLVNVRIPHEPFNTYVRDGSIAELIPRVMAESKPEAVYFTEQNGHRGAVLIVNVESASHIPALAVVPAVQRRLRVPHRDECGGFAAGGVGGDWRQVEMRSDPEALAP